MTKNGGKRTTKEIKQFLEASYQDKPPEKIDNWVLDKKLSTKVAKVYYNPETNEAVVSHRGTKGALDWGNNLAYALGAYELTPRYWKGKSVQDKAEKKYGKKNISTLAHSQGAVLSRKLGADTKEVINVNPAYTFERPKKNEYNIRSSTDVVSGLYTPISALRPKHDITIPSKSATDVLGEHSYNILDRLGENKEIGAGFFSSNNIGMKGGKRQKKLGYDAEDIDWCGGGQTFSQAVNTVTDTLTDPEFHGVVFYTLNYPEFAQRALNAETQEDLDNVYRDIYRFSWDAPLDDPTVRSAQDWLFGAMERAVHSRNINRPVTEHLTIRPRNWAAPQVQQERQERQAKRKFIGKEKNLLDALKRRELKGKGRKPEDDEMSSSSSEDEMEGGNRELNQERKGRGLKGGIRQQVHFNPLEVLDLIYDLEQSIAENNVTVPEEIQNVLAELEDKANILLLDLTDDLFHETNTEVGNLLFELNQWLNTFQQGGKRLKGKKLKGGMMAANDDESSGEETVPDEDDPLPLYKGEVVDFPTYNGQEIINYAINVTNFIGNALQHYPQTEALLTELEDLGNLLNLNLSYNAYRDTNNRIRELMNNLIEWLQDFTDPEHVWETDPEFQGGKKLNLGKAFKSVGKAFDKAGQKMTLGMAKFGEKVNPFASKKFQKGSQGLGTATNDYLLPAVVSTGKPIYDATAMTASTMLTGNPVLGKAVGDTLWNKMVAEKGYDPRQRQKSKALGVASSKVGQLLAKPYSAKLKGGKKQKRGGASVRQIGDASAMRTFGDYGTPTFNLLSSIVHSADKKDKYLSPFRDITVSFDAEVEYILNQMKPTYLNQLFYFIKNSSEVPPEQKQVVLNNILAIYPDARKKIPTEQRWAKDDPRIAYWLELIKSRPAHPA